MSIASVTTSDGHATTPSASSVVYLLALRVSDGMHHPSFMFCLPSAYPFTCRLLYSWPVWAPGWCFRMFDWLLLKAVTLAQNLGCLPYPSHLTDGLHSLVSTVSPSLHLHPFGHLL